MSRFFGGQQQVRKTSVAIAQCTAPVNPVTGTRIAFAIFGCHDAAVFFCYGGSDARAFVVGGKD